MDNDQKICYYCGAILESGIESNGKTFCNTEHEKDFLKVVKSGNSLNIKIDDKTTIRTQKYDRVPQIVKRYKDMIDNPYSRRFF